MLRVLHVVETLDDASGGLPAAAVAIASSHARLGHAVALIASTTPADTHDGLAAAHPDVDVHLFLRGGPGARWYDSPDLTSYVREQVRSVDVVHVHGVWNLPVQRASRIAQRHGVPVVLCPHGGLDEHDLAKHGGLKRLLGRPVVGPWLRRIDLVLCTSPRESDLLVTYGATVESTSAPLPPGPAPDGRPGRARERWGIPAGAPLVVAIGRLDPKKRVDLAIDALALMPDTTHLLLAGSGAADFEAEVRARVAASPAAARIVLTGWIDPDARADLLADADVFVLVSDRENYGIAAVEAAQAGVPSVLSAEVFAGDLLRDAGAAVVAERDPASTAAALMSVLEPDTQVRMRDAARALASTALAETAVDESYGEALAHVVVRRAAS